MRKYQHMFALFEVPFLRESYRGKRGKGGGVEVCIHVRVWVFTNISTFAFYLNCLVCEKVIEEERGRGEKMCVSVYMCSGVRMRTYI